MSDIVKNRRSSIPPYLCALIYGAGIVVASGMSYAWLGLIFIGTAALMFLFWMGNLKESLLYIFIFTSAFEIKKALVAVGGVYSPGLSLFLPDLSLYPLLLLWLFDNKIVRKRKILWPSTLHRLAFIFLLWNWITAVFSGDPLAGVLAAVSYTKFYFIFLFISDFVQTPRQVRNILIALGLSMFCQALMAAAQTAAGSPLQIQGTNITTLGTRLVFQIGGGSSAFRPQGFLGHPNVLADYCVFILPVMLAMVLGRKQIVGRNFWIFSAVSLIVGTCVLIVSLSRGGWISFFMAALFILLMGLRSGLVSKRQIGGLVLAGVFFGFTVIAVYPSVVYRIIGRDQRATDSRVAMMRQALLIIKRNPVVGVGLGGYNRAAQINRPMSWARLSVPFQETLLEGIVHNKYLLTAAENGVIGLVLMLAILIAPLLSVWRYYAWRDPAYYLLAIGIGAAIFGQMWFYMFDHFYNDVRIHYLWLYLGLLSALWRMQAGSGAAKQPATHSTN